MRTPVFCIDSLVQHWKAVVEILTAQKPHVEAQSSDVVEVSVPGIKLKVF